MNEAEDISEARETDRVRLNRSNVVLVPTGLSLRSHCVDPSFWATADEQPELADGRLLSVFDYEGDWTWWERHPLGDELVYVLTGEVEFLLDDGDQHWSIDLPPGTASIVPRGTWHSARVPKPSTVLFVTPTPARTEHRHLQ